MADNTRELDQIQDNLQTLHARSQTNRAHLQKPEAVCEERYDQILSTLELVQSDMEKIGQNWILSCWAGSKMKIFEKFLFRGASLLIWNEKMD